MKNPYNQKPDTQNSSHSTNDTDAFFADAVDPKVEARALALEVITHLLIWMSEGTTLEQRGLRAVVALRCIRPDLIGGMTFERIGDEAGCTRQTIHKLADDFRKNMGLLS